VTTSIHDLLLLVRNQQGALLGRKSAESLSAFLSGYAFAKREAGDAGDADFLLGFNEWVHGRFKLQSTQGWAKVISCYCNQEADEMELFWKLYDEYTSRSRNDRHRAKTNGHPSRAGKKIGVQ